MNVKYIVLLNYISNMNDNIHVSAHGFPHHVFGLHVLLHPHTDLTDDVRVHGAVPQRFLDQSLVLSLSLD